MGKKPSLNFKFVGGCSRGIMVCFHKYTTYVGEDGLIHPFGSEYYQPIFDHFVSSLTKFQEEYDKIYFLDSTWNFTEGDREKIKRTKGNVVKVDPNLRYYNAYKEVLPQVKEDLVLLLDNDTVIYREGVIGSIFESLKDFDVATIYVSIGTYKTDKLGGRNKFCPYLFATRKELLMKYLDVEWGSNMPEHETLGKLTEKMLDDGIEPFELEGDMNSIYFDGARDGEKGKDLGYMHIRAGSEPAYLLAAKEYGHSRTYWDHLRNQPVGECLRRLAWFDYMGAKKEWTLTILNDLISIKAPTDDWLTMWPEYLRRFREYHNL